MSSMKRGIQHVRVGHAAAAHKQSKRAACDISAYKAPTNGQSVDVSKPVTLSWDPSCISGSNIDIYLFSPAASSFLHMWKNQPNAPGQYDATFTPSWWNSTASESMQLVLVPTGTPTYLKTLPAGPVFTASFSGDAATSNNGGDGPGGQTVLGQAVVHKGTSKGGIAAAVIVVLLVVGGAIAGYFYWQRKKQAKKNEQSRAVIDARMSQVSQDWRAMTAGGHDGGRKSMAFNGARASTYSFGNPGARPETIFSVDGTGNSAGFGSSAADHGMGLYTHENGEIRGSMDDLPAARPRPRRENSAPRASRVSFATDTRVSRVSFASDGRKTVTSRAFHNGFVPPVPGTAEFDEVMSSEQADGAHALTRDEINHRVSMARDSGADYMPAIRMMRMEDSDGQAAEYVVPKPPAAVTHKSGKSSSSLKNAMSPDDMLRAYALRQNAATGKNNLAYPSPAANSNSNTMRVLYSPTSPENDITASRSAPISKRKQTYSAGPGMYDPENEDEAYA